MFIEHFFILSLIMIIFENMIDYKEQLSNMFLTLINVCLLFVDVVMKSWNGLRAYKFIFREQK